MPDPTPVPAPPSGEIPTPVFADERVQLFLGDTVEILPHLEAGTVDAVVTDPPYGLSFNGHTWDGIEGFRESLPSIDTAGMSGPEVFEEWCTAWGAGALRMLKPGGHLAAFGGARTWHRMVRGLERAGFEIRDQIAWLHTTGMPKSMDLSHAIAKHHGAHRPDRNVQQTDRDGVLGTTRTVQSAGTPVTEEAARWEGWGTALRPAFEPIVIARKPPDGNLIRNVLMHGVGGINVDAGRFGGGRWPTNVAFDEQQANVLDVLSGSWQGDSLSRKFPIFRFEHKPGVDERPRAFGVSHSTVKPLGLMRWLLTLLTPAGGLVLEPFAGSGTTVEAAVAAGFRVVAVEKDASYIPLVVSRLGRRI